MKAAVLYQPLTPFQVEDLDIIEPRAGEIRVRIGACGVCRSDHHIWDGSMGSRLPMVLGHEAAGTVEAVGPGVTSLQLGQRVILTVRRPCGACALCQSGKSELCSVNSGRGGGLQDGTVPFFKNGEPVYSMANISGFGQQTITMAGAVAPIADDIPFEVGALIGCGVTTGVGAALMTAKVQPGSTVAVIGTGGVGMSVIQGARIAGASRIIAVDLLDNKLEMAMKVGATHAVNSSKQDPVPEVQRLSGGFGADFTFDAIGGAGTITQAYEMARVGGTVTMVGVPPLADTLSLPAQSLVLRPKTLKGCLMGGAGGPALALLLVELYRSGQLRVDEMVTKKYALEDINEAFAALERGDNARGVIVHAR
jgi:S-(hydroxymethyl)glutathione dehydrogenase/alcohol dehydrogenase